MNIAGKVDRRFKGLAFIGVGYLCFSSYYACLNHVFSPGVVSNDNVSTVDQIHVAASEKPHVNLADEALLSVSNILPVPEQTLNLSNENKETYSLKNVNFRGKNVILAEGKINSSFYESAQAIGIPNNVIHSFISILRPRINFRSGLRQGDTFSVAYTSSGEIIHLSVKTRKLDLSVYKHPDDNKYYLGNGSPVNGRAEAFRKPINSARISSPYGVRMHPVSNVIKKHNGVDYAAPQGTPVYAVGNGRVKVRSYDSLSGKHVIIRHANGYESLYAHLSSFGDINVGQHVNSGDVIGRVGSTGRSTGHHLHFGIKKNGVYINPTNRVISEKTKLCGAGYNKFNRYITEMNKALSAAKPQNEQKL